MRRCLAEERGFTVFETVLSMVIFLFVVGAAMSFVIVSIDQQNAVSSRTAAAGQAETGLEQMVRDLRHAMTTDSSGNALALTVSTNAAAGTTSVSFSIPSPGGAGSATTYTSAQTVTWTCPSAAAASTYVGSCTRTLAGGSTVAMVAGVQSMTFTPVDASGTSHALSTSTSSSYTNPAALAITLDVQPVSQLDTAGSHILRGAANVIAVQTTVDLRNFT